MSRKVYDAEEGSRERAVRLIGMSINRRSEESRKVVNRLVLHARNLSHADRMAAIEYLRRDADLLVGLLEQVGDEDLPEFTFPSQSIEAEWSYG